MCSAWLKSGLELGFHSKLVLWARLFWKGSHKSSTKEYNRGSSTTCLLGTALIHMATDSTTQHRTEQDTVHVLQAKVQELATNDTVCLEIKTTHTHAHAQTM